MGRCSPLSSDSRAFDIAQALLGGFDHHYKLFRATSDEAKARFERGDWPGQQRAKALRIEFYDARVAEASALLEERFAASSLAMDVWQQVQLHYIGLLNNYLQPELAETFFNSVCTRILHHAYFHNDFIFVRPAISTEYIENDAPAATPNGEMHERRAVSTLLHKCRIGRREARGGRCRSGPLVEA